MSDEMDAEGYELLARGYAILAARARARKAEHGDGEPGAVSEPVTRRSRRVDDVSRARVKELCRRKGIRIREAS